ncbi:MAG: LPS assembly lipoprotein LptE [Gammaproteobacteria bacterium]
MNEPLARTRLRAARRPAALLLAAVLAAIAGCGFHLRGSRPVDIGVARAYVQSVNADLVASELRRLFVESGIALTGAPAGAGLIVQLSGERFERRVLSVDPETGKVREFELNYELRLDVRKPDGTPVISKESVTLERDFTFDETAVLGKFEEQTLLEHELRIDAAETVLRRLEALKL